MNLNMPSIFIKMERGSCPYCGGTVRVLESEISETVLNSNGYPKAQESLSYNCVGYCCSCNNPVYIDPTGNGYQTIPYNENSIYLHNKIKDILGDKQKSNKHQCSIPITLSIPDNEFVKK